MPTLVMHRADYGLIPASHGRYLAAHVRGAEFIELPGADGPMYWEAPDLILGHIRSSSDATRAHRRRSSQRSCSVTSSGPRRWRSPSVTVSGAR